MVHSPTSSLCSPADSPTHVNSSLPSEAFRANSALPDAAFVDIAALESSRLETPVSDITAACAHDALANISTIITNRDFDLTQIMSKSDRELIIPADLISNTSADDYLDQAANPATPMTRQPQPTNNKSLIELSKLSNNVLVSTIADSLTNAAANSQRDTRCWNAIQDYCCYTQASGRQILLETMGIALSVGIPVGLLFAATQQNINDTNVIASVLGCSVGALSGLGWFAWRLKQFNS